MKKLYQYTVDRGFTPLFVVLALVIAGGISFSLIQGVRQTFSDAKTAEVAEARGEVVEVTKIDKSILEKSSYIGPFLVSVLRGDGSFSYAVVVQADLTDDQFAGEVQIQYPNGDFGSIEEKNGTVDLFFTKKGARESVAIVDRLITGIRLPDDSILPVKFRDASIREGKLVGDFQFLAFADKKLVNGRFTSRGDLTSLVVLPSLTSADTTSLLVMRELLKMVYASDGNGEENVLGIQSSAGSVLAETPTGPSSSSTTVSSISSSVVARRYEDEGVIRLFQQASALGPAIT